LAGLLRILAPLGITAACLWLLRAALDPASVLAVPDLLRDLPMGRLAGALLCCLLSFWAIGRYDAVAHRHFVTGISGPQARASGTIAIALAQTLGFGILTGAAVRWRMLPALAPLDGLRLSTFVAVTFLGAWAALTAAAVLVLPAPAWTAAPAFAVLVALPAGLYLVLILPHHHSRVQLPSLCSLRAIAGWTAIDLLAAALMLYLLLPDIPLGFAAFLPVFLLAFGAGLLSGAPGGIGPFELICLGLLPQLPPAQLLAGIIAFRALYYALPAVIAALCLLRPLRPQRRIPPPGKGPPRSVTRAEVGLIRQNGGWINIAPQSTLALWQTPQSLAALFDPVAGHPAMALPAVVQAAKRANRLPCIYKCGPRLAAHARAQGWQVLRIAQEACLDPRDFDLSQPSRRGLRRKLRAAVRQDVHTSAPAELPLRQMALLDADWQRRQGRALGGTMGRFCPEYVQDQQVFLAHHNGRLVGFASFHHSDHEFCLDLMRSGSDAPDGTMQALVHAALQQAARFDIPRLSLAAVPSFAAKGLIWPRLIRQGSRAGLRQFKASFAPQWQPLYAAAPGPVALAIALADITAAVHHPPALPSCRILHDDDEEFEIALRWVS
jgi:phosphatidylglycerol lysyltransferase